MNAILKSVSRSFYLTIRFLPRPLREPVGLAYLLARATDTIADTAEIPAAIRLTTLQTTRLGSLPAKRSSARSLRRCENLPRNKAIAPSAVDRKPRPLHRTARDDRTRTIATIFATVLATIVRGQELDLRAFRRSGNADCAAERRGTRRIHLPCRRLCGRFLDEARLPALPAVCRSPRRKRCRSSGSSTAKVCS